MVDTKPPSVLQNPHSRVCDDFAPKEAGALSDLPTGADDETLAAFGTNRYITAKATIPEAAIR
jgi:hypothetical protein